MSAVQQVVKEAPKRKAPTRKADKPAETEPIKHIAETLTAILKGGKKSVATETAKKPRAKAEESVAAPVSTETTKKPRAKTSATEKKPMAEMPVEPVMAETTKKPRAKTNAAEKKVKTESIVELVVESAVAETATVGETVKKPRAKKTVDGAEKKAAKPRKPIQDTGLYVSVNKVKNVIINVCVNKATHDALTDLRNNRVPTETDCAAERSCVFTLATLKPETRAHLVEVLKQHVAKAKHDFARQKVKEMDAETRRSYSESRKTIKDVWNKMMKDSHRLESEKFDSTESDLLWHQDFYADFTEPSDSGLVNQQLYEFWHELVSKTKIRFNYESKVYITAFIECAIRQLILRGTMACVADGKKIIQMGHALGGASNASSAPLLEFISSLSSYRRAAELVNRAQNSTSSAEESALAAQELKSVLDQNAVSDDKKLSFKHYVIVLCRVIREELVAAETTPEGQAKYNNVSVSEMFKLFCSNIILELLKMIGKVLSIEVSTRNVKTINYTSISTLISIMHDVHNIGDTLPSTMDFVQTRSHKYFAHDDSCKATRRAEKEALVASGQAKVRSPRARKAAVETPISA